MRPTTDQQNKMTTNKITNKQLTEEHSMNFERKAAEVRRIVEEAMEMYADEVAAGDLEESSDISESFRRGVAHAVCAMIRIQEEYEIKTEEERVRAANN